MEQVLALLNATIRELTAELGRLREATEKNGSEGKAGQTYSGWGPRCNCAGKDSTEQAARRVRQVYGQH